MLMFCSLPAPHVLRRFACPRLFSLHLCKRASNAASCHGDRKNHGDPGDGRWTGIPRRRPEKRIADQSRHSQAVGFRTGTWREQDSLGQGIPRGPRWRRGVSSCCICYHCHWRGGGGEKRDMRVYFQRVSLSHRFLVTCGVKGNLVGSAGDLPGLS